jgi:uncharacterized protein (TIGR02265 family)
MTESVRIKGSVLKTRLAFVQDLAQQEGVDRVLRRMPAADQAELKNLLATKWYPFSLGKHLDQAIVNEIGGGDPAFFEKLGAASADKNLAGVHKEFLVVGNPQEFLSRAPMIYSFYYDKGRRDYAKTGPNEAVLTTHDAETFSLADCATVVGWHRRALEMCGAAQPQVVEEECRARGGAVCRYRLSWS